MKKSLSHPALRAVVVVALALLSLAGSVLLSAAAPAGANGYTGGGGGGATGGSGTPYAGTNCVMVNNNGTVWTTGVLNGVQIYNNPYPGCLGYPDPPADGVPVYYHANGTSTGNWGLCVAGFDVWRFYGNQANPTQGWTISQVNVPAICNSPDGGGGVVPESSNWHVYSPDPADSGALGLAQVSAANDPFIGATSISTLNQTVATDQSWTLTTAAPVYAQGLGCGALIANPDPNVVVGTVNNTSASNQSQLDTYIAQWSPLFGPRVALLMADEANINGTDVYQGANFSRVPACASGANMSSANTGVATDSVFGACVVPTQQLAGTYSTPASGFQNTYPTAGGQRVYEDTADGIYGNRQGGSLAGPYTTWESGTNAVGGVTAVTANPSGSGYYLVSGSGAVYAYGAARYNGGASGSNPSKIVAMSPVSGGGYDLFASNGAVYSYGTAGYYGGASGIHLNAPIVAATTTPDGKGYWLVSADGGVFTYGDATYAGSMGGKPLNAPIVGMDRTKSGTGYWLVAADGGVFAFNAPFYGSAGNIHLNKPIVAMSATSDGKGYWFTASDGGMFAYGDASFQGSPASSGGLDFPVVGMASTGTDGYWLVTSNGAVYNYGSATYVPISKPNTNPPQSVPGESGAQENGPDPLNPDAFDAQFRYAVYNSMYAKQVNLGQAYGAPVGGAYFGGLLNEPWDSTTFGLDTTAWQAASYADCFLGQFAASLQHAPTKVVKSPTCQTGCATPTFSGTLPISVTAPTTLQVGGALNEATFSATSPGVTVTCTSNCTGINWSGTASNFTWKLGLASLTPSTYTLCATGETTGCDYGIASETPTTDTNGDTIGDTIVTGFYNATDPSAGQGLYADVTPGSSSATVQVSWVQEWSTGPVLKTATITVTPTVQITSTTGTGTQSNPLQVVAGRPAA